MAAITKAKRPPHRRVKWRQPPSPFPKPDGSKKHWPRLLDSVKESWVRAMERREGRLWSLVRRAAIVAGYPLDRAFDRKRALRKDMRDTLLAFIVPVLYHSDLTTGFVGSPTKSGRGPWYRFTMEELAEKAFGAASDAEIRRAQRAQDVLINLGVLVPTRQVRRYRQGIDAVRSDPGVRIVNWQRLAELCGCVALWENDLDWRTKQYQQRLQAQRGTATPRDVVTTAAPALAGDGADTEPDSS